MVAPILQQRLNTSPASRCMVKPLPSVHHCPRVVQQRQQSTHHRQQRWHTNIAAAAGDQPGQEPLPAAAAAAAAAAPEDQQLPQHMVASASSLGIPPGPMEPEDEQPKKLSPAARLSDELASTSITIIGDDTELNWAVCQALSKKIGWFPVSTTRILLGLSKAASLAELVERDGRQALVDAEAKVLAGMRDQLRCCVATTGDGAATDPAVYRNLHGSIVIWLDEEDKRAPKPFSSARSIFYQQSEVRAKLTGGKGGFGDKPQPLEGKSSKAAAQLIKTLLQLLKENETLLARKRLYVEFGCRGDWPDVMPEDWRPEGEEAAAAGSVVDGFERKPVA